MSNYSLFSSASRREETWGCRKPGYGFPGTTASQHQPAAAISQLLPSSLFQLLAREWLHLEHNISWNSLSISISYCCCCLILWLASPQGLFNHYHFQFSLAHWACVLRNNFPRGDLAAFFFQVDSHFAFPVHIFFSLGTILFFYVSIPVVFIVPVTSVPPTNFINVLFSLLQNTAFFSIYNEASFPTHRCPQNNRIS